LLVHVPKVIAHCLSATGKWKVIALTNNIAGWGQCTLSAESLLSRLGISHADAEMLTKRIAGQLLPKYPSSFSSFFATVLPFTFLPLQPARYIEPSLSTGTHPSQPLPGTPGSRRPHQPQNVTIAQCRRSPASYLR
jgi:hypothetical protein